MLLHRNSATEHGGGNGSLKTRRRILEKGKGKVHLYSTAFAYTTFSHAIITNKAQGKTKHTPT